MTASVVNCQSIVQVSRYQVVPNFLLPRYLEKWLARIWRQLQVVENMERETGLEPA
jgi:hypothetical protein